MLNVKCPVGNCLKNLAQVLSKDMQGVLGFLFFCLSAVLIKSRSFLCGGVGGAHTMPSVCDDDDNETM